jgi:hypothetical protein
MRGMQRRGPYGSCSHRWTGLGLLVVVGFAGGVNARLLDSRVRGLSYRVAAFGLSGLRESDILFITVSHCAWQRVISLSLATKQRNRFQNAGTLVSTACSFDSWVPQKHGARQSHGCVKPSFSEHGYPHASPPVTEPAQGSPCAIRENHPPNLYARRTASPTRQVTKPQKCVSRNRRR